MNKDTVEEAEKRPLDGQAHPPAGPHNKPHLQDESETPGAGSLPDKRDESVSPGSSRNGKMGAQPDGERPNPLGYDCGGGRKWLTLMSTESQRLSKRLMNERKTDFVRIGFLAQVIHSASTG